jgi:Signal transduction histidine kinase
MDQGSRYLHRDYYQTQQFRQQLDQFAAYLNLFELNSSSAQAAKNSIKVEPEEIMDYRNQLGLLTDQMNAIQSEYELLIQEASAEGNNKAADYYIAQRDSKLEDLMKLFKDDDFVVSLIRKGKEQRIDSYYRQRETYRSEYNNLKSQFDYYLWNPAASFVHTSLNVQDHDSARNELYSNDHVFTTDYTIDITNSLHYLIGAHELLDDSIIPYQGWIAVPKDSPLREAAKRYSWEQLLLFAYCLTSIALLLAALKRFKGIVEAQAETNQWAASYRKIPLDTKLLLFAGAAALTVGLLVNMAGHYPSMLVMPLLYGGKLFITLSIATIGMALSLLQGQFLASELRSWSDIRRQWSGSLLRRGGLRVKAAFVQIINQVKDSFIYKSTGIRLLILALILIGLGLIGMWGAVLLFQYRSYNELSSIVPFVPILAVIGIVAILITVRQSIHLNRVAKAADELAAGRMPSEIPESGSGVLGSLAANINALRQGVTILQNEQAKSERLKTELITNVSHDLRTPLTSIMTYAGLLRSEESTVEERAAYVEIIDQKSKRLKTMIDDLFEISTMTSGNAKLLLETTDLVQLMQQALAEYKEAMDSSDIQFRVSLPEGPIYTIADGQKLWRAFDNLIGNMLKYSLAHTRAYISMQLTEGHEVAIIFKNVSKYEISDNTDELFERFKRGDTSRHTEGSGLGLAIAKSIIDLHEGRLTLETDGDLFKASVILQQQ